MSALAPTDLDAILDTSLEARAFPDVEAFRVGVLPLVRRLVACDLAAYNEIDLVNRTAVGVFDPADTVVDAGLEHFPRFMHQHPLVARVDAGDRAAHAISDFLSERAYHGLGLYQDLFRPIEVEDQLALGLPGDLVVGIILNRSSRSFTERDREVLDVLRPHLTAGYLEAQQRRRAALVIAALDAGLDEATDAVVVLDRHGALAHASPCATELLAAYGGEEPTHGGGLPRFLSDWVRAVAGGETDGPLLVAGPRGLLHVRALDGHGIDPWRALLLRERRTQPPSVESLRALGLSGREAQVLRLVACGKRDGDIARELFISVGTVRKHLQHVYRRLGVDSRTQAVTRALK